MATQCLSDGFGVRASLITSFVMASLSPWMEEGSLGSAEEEKGQQSSKTTPSAPEWCSGALILLHCQGSAPMAGLQELPANEWVCCEDGRGEGAFCSKQMRRTKCLQFLGH